MLSDPRRLLFTCSLSLLLGACGDGGGSRTAVSPAAAKVDGAEISLSQVNAVLARVQSKAAAEGSVRARKAVLERLIDQQLLYTEGVALRLDRDPKVAELIEAARREIVARAYMDKLLAAPPAITPAEVHQYYVENPALFAQRRIYNLQELSFPANEALLGALRRMTEQGRSMAEIKRFLVARGVEHASAAGVRTAEQVPLDVLPRLAAMEDGQTALIESGARYYVFHVLSSQLAPIAEREARRQIEVFLGNERGQRIVAQELMRLKSGARIEYLGEFAKTVDGGTNATVAALKTERTSR